MRRMALEAFKTVLATKGLQAKGRLFSYFEPALEEEAVLVEYVEELLGVRDRLGRFRGHLGVAA